MEDEKGILGANGYSHRGVVPNNLGVDKCHIPFTDKNLTKYVTLSGKVDQTLDNLSHDEHCLVPAGTLRTIWLVLKVLTD
ncbi:unnamed protein product [Sphenostylis stenocarpa]|uniref:Uncharacterized protein n=1 Tax=Sphenostylis stenocarpa TaxID=92480 RepID=A0AA86SH77_9FABA|nr:unnamed protein product [Sphenostylis stenocarpa]